ncbi:zinc finger protein 662 [Eupeodes corollae]|uniref:zinc finger protein 662 n=1 Tax=Eupeodes corollae TaxID=290404 RepID=UPI002491298A|nr:zinc finger protein 662 [Eupeodes corollae]
MTDVRMGLKHVILQRVQNFDTPTEHKRITDFSINRILGDGDGDTVSSVEVSEKDKITSAGILDLSKNRSSQDFLKFPSSINSNDFERIPYFPTNTMILNPYVNHALNFAPPPHPPPIAPRNPGCCNGEVIRPRVCKYFTATSTTTNSVPNCNDCDMFYKNLNFPKYPLYPKDNNSVANVWFGAAAAAQFVNSQEFAENLLVNSVSVVKTQMGIVNNNTAAAGTIGKLTPSLVKGDIQGRRGNVKDINNEDETSFKCSICEKVFGCADTLQSHEKTHKSPRYECLDCGKGFSQLRNYKYHLSVHRGTKEFAAECPECGKTFNDKGYLSSHMKIHRNKKEYECPYCPKSFNQRVAFNMHVRIHTGVKPHKCTECGKRFSRKMLLKQHMRTHSGEKPYQCSVCGKSFADRSNMTLHHRLHSGIKPFNCPICPKAFTKKHHLKTHLNYHTGCKPYICPHPNCNQAFTQSSNMRTHAKKCQFKPAHYPAVISTQLAPSISPPSVPPTRMMQQAMLMQQIPFQC